MPEAMLSEVDKKVIRGIHHAVAERGADWVYPDGFDDDWHIGTMCVNLLPDNQTPACIIGWTAVDQGLPTYRESSALWDAERWEVSKLVGEAMQAAQEAQDCGGYWGESLRHFNDTLLENYVTQEEIDAALEEEK